jgi:hypothetical protein
MRIPFTDIEGAFDFVSSSPDYECSALVSLDTGDIYYVSPDFQDENLPEDAWESDRYVEIPHQHDLDLGRELVREFVANRVPDLEERIAGFFRQRGAYVRYKDLLA